MKTLFLTLVSILVAILAVAVIMPKDFEIQESIVINKPQDEVFDYLRMVRNSNEWSPWVKKDPDMIQTSIGIDGAVGFINSWSGNKKVGSGEQEIINIIPNQRVDFALRFSRPIKITQRSYFIIEPAENNQTKVTWGIVGRNKFPYNILCYFKQKQIRDDFVDGLEDLKQILESK